MKVPHHLFSFVVLVVSLATIAPGQPSNSTTKNNPYSPSPSGKAAIADLASTLKVQPAPTPTKIVPQQVAFAVKDSRAISRDEQPRVVERESTVTEAPRRPATNLYRIGVGDVVLINLKNSPHGSGYYTVREKGLIDYPLAGPAVSIGDLTSDEAAAMLRSAIKLFEDPQVEVRVQFYLSRSFTVEGLANNTGEKILRREAMPLFAIRAESEVQREATTARVTRAVNSTVESYVLSDAATDNVLIVAGDRVEFVEEKKTEVAQYTLAGAKKQLVAGTKLSEAVAELIGQIAAPKQAFLRRRADKGAVTISEYDIRAIKKGKAQDPVLLPGDVIEIKE